MDFFRKYPVKILPGCTLLVLAAAFFLLSLNPGVPGVRAEGASFSASWSEKSYAPGEEVRIQLSLSGLPASAQVTGSVSVLLYGLENASFFTGEGALQTSYNTTGTPAVFQISVSEGAFVTVDAGGVWNIGELTVKISEGSTASRFTLQAALTEQAGGTVPVAAAEYGITRTSEDPPPGTETGGGTETPPASAAPNTQTPGGSGTPPASAAPNTQTPGQLPPTGGPSGSPSPGTGTGTATPSASPTAVPTEPPATLTVIETAPPSQSIPPSGSAPSGTTPDRAEESFLPSAPSAGPDPGQTESEPNPVSVGAVVFWSIVSLVGGIWIGIAIGAFIWRKKSVFMTAEEKKIIGRF